MSISITFNRTDKYLKVKITGKWVTDDALEVIDAIKKEADIQKVKHILLDLMELSRPASEITRYYSGLKIASAFDYSYKIAGYAQGEKINRFAENVAVNRGANMKIFTCETDAVNWLQGMLD